MQIVIDIDENVFTRLFDNGIEDYAIMNDDLFAIAKSIRMCTPLPKGHGRILDEKDILDTENNDGGWYDLTDMPEYIAGVKAIIEADKASPTGAEAQESKDKCKNCKYYRNPDYTRCHDCKAESEVQKNVD